MLILHPEEQLNVVRGLFNEIFYERSFFSICEVDKILQVTRRHPDAEMYSFLRTLHCVSYKLLSPDTIQGLKEAVAGMSGYSIEELMPKPKIFAPKPRPTEPPVVYELEEIRTLKPRKFTERLRLLLNVSNR